MSLEDEIKRCKISVNFATRRSLTAQVGPFLKGQGSQNNPPEIKIQAGTSGTDSHWHPFLVLLLQLSVVESSRDQALYVLYRELANTKAFQNKLDEAVHM